MKITVKNKKELQEMITDLRHKGFNLVTLYKDFAEMEKGDKFITIEKR